MIKLKPVEQSSGFCGPASLVSLLDYYGYKSTEKELAKLCNATEELGTEPDDLIKGLKKLKVKAVAQQFGSWSTLKKLIDAGAPVLVNWWSDYGLPHDGHYSVVYRMTDKSIYLMDPELGGSRRMTKAKFMRQWYDFYLNGKKNTRWYMYIQKPR